MKYLFTFGLVVFFIGCGNETTQHTTHSQTTNESVKKEQKVQSSAVEKKVIKGVAKTEPLQPVVEKKVQQKVVKINAETLYKSCAGCHGAHAEKKALGKSEVIKGWSAAKLTDALEGYKKGTRNVHGMGALMKGQVSKLSQEQIKLLSEYISKFE